jgi:hypothetical protein
VISEKSTASPPGVYSERTKPLKLEKLAVEKKNFSKGATKRMTLPRSVPGHPHKRSPESNLE